MTTEDPTTLGDALPAEMARVREIKADYDALPGGAGKLGAWLMEQTLKQADRAIIEGDLPGMIAVYEQLQGFTQ